MAVDPPRRAGRTRRVVAGLALALAALTGCAEGQDPGVEPSGDQPAPSSNTLGSCPPGGPDDTTPGVGCIGPDGSVLRPEGRN
ncbi:MAG: hypothetical protein U5K30_17140 [Acidimicrobiales bacterium]|nr:hypothetical protein [Acidimicrobiales bacterium]